MNIAEKIQKIIDNRKKNIPDIDRRIRILKDMLASLDKLDDRKAHTVDSDGNRIADGKYAGLLAWNPDLEWKVANLDTSACRTAVQAAIGALEENRKRFSREYVSISVIGEARKGKSEFLKTISGLNDLVIPAYASTDCTGAPSIIRNRPGSSLTARLTFKSEAEMVGMAQEYINRMLPEEKRIYLNSVEDIPALDIDEVAERIPGGSKNGVLLGYLKKMAEHYCEWREFAGHEEIELYSEAEIAQFVSQNNGVKPGNPGRREYYRYLAVESCQITCGFRQEDAGKICLIDTVGLGDHTIGIEENMLNVVRNESDAAIFVIMPENGSGGGLPTSFTDIYGRIENYCSGMQLDKWMFYLINHVTAEPVPPKSYPHVNTEFCEAAMENFRLSTFAGKETAQIVSVIDESAVRDQFMTALLLRLSANLPEIDGLYLQKSNDTLKKAGTEFMNIFLKTQNVLNTGFRRSTKMVPLINELSDRKLELIQEKLFKLRERWMEKRNCPCTAIYQMSGKIIRKMVQNTDSYLPSQRTILSELETGVQAPAIYIKYANQIRNAISGDFLNMDIELKETVNKMKDEVSEVLYGECGFSALCTRDESKPHYVWLEDFSKDVLGDGEEYQNIKLAFDTICRFDFSVKGFMTYEIRNCLDELDPNIAYPPQIIAKAGQKERTAANIYMALLKRTCEISDTIESVVKELSIKPNRAMFAEVSEFYDRTIYAEGVQREWRNLLADKAGLLWTDEVRQAESIGIASQDWIDIVEELQKYNKNSYFQVRVSNYENN